MNILGILTGIGSIYFVFYMGSLPEPKPWWMGPTWLTLMIISFVFWTLSKPSAPKDESNEGEKSVGRSNG